MNELVISFEKTDRELIDALNCQFGENIKYEENKGFNGLEVLITAIIPISALTVQVIDFILSNLKEKSSDDKKRVLIDADGSIDLRGYTEEEARKIINCYFSNKND